MLSATEVYGCQIYSCVYAKSFRRRYRCQDDDFKAKGVPQVLGSSLNITTNLYPFQPRNPVQRASNIFLCL